MRLLRRGSPERTACFILGTLLFLALWLVFMWLANPRFRKSQHEVVEAE